MDIENQIFILLIIVTIQPLVYGIAIFYLIYRIISKLERFGSILGQLQLDKAGTQDVQSEIEHSLDYLSREIAAAQGTYDRVKFIHQWINRIDDKFTLLNICLADILDLVRESRSDGQ